MRINMGSKIHIIHSDSDGLKNQKNRPYKVILRNKNGKVIADISFIAHHKKQNRLSDLITNSVNEEFIVSNLVIQKSE